jgi:hypothetical protein
MLAAFDALFAAQLSTIASFTMFWFDFLSVWAVVMIMVHIPVFRRIFERVRVIGPYLRHLEDLH